MANTAGRLPTDLRILDAIFERYRGEFSRGSKDSPIAFSETMAPSWPMRDSKIYVPIDVEAVAADLKADPHLVFGQLYYYLDHKHRYVQSDGRTEVSLFSLAVGKQKHCVNFPLLASVVAGMREETKKHQQTFWIAVLSLVISVLSLGISLVKP